jgi:hypothetical protein
MIAAHKSALKAWKSKLTAFQNVIKKPLLVESSEDVSVSNVLQPNCHEPAFKREE